MLLKLRASLRIRSQMGKHGDGKDSEIRFEPLQVQAARFIGRGLINLTRWLRDVCYRLTR